MTQFLLCFFVITIIRKRIKVLVRSMYFIAEIKK